MLCAGPGVAQLTVTGSQSTGYTATMTGDADGCVDEGDVPTTSVMFAGYSTSDEGFTAAYGLPANFLGPGYYAASGSYSGFTGVDDMGNPCTSAPQSGSGGVQVPGGVGSTTTFSSGPTKPVPEGQPVAFSVSVGPQISYVQFDSPTGTVSLLYGRETLATAMLGNAGANTNAIANFSVSSQGFAPGTYAITAAYSGDSNYLPSTSAAFTVTIASPQEPTSIALIVTPNPLVVGDTVTLRGSISTSPNESNPTGTISFVADGEVLGTEAVGEGAVSILTLSSKGIAPGMYSVVAKYSGDASNLPSTSLAVPVTVEAKAGTTSAITAQPASGVVQGQSVTLQATVTQTVGNTPPGGKVQITANGAVVSTLPLSGGTASLSVSTDGLPAGNYSLAANYPGSATDEPSTSPAVPFVLLAATATNVSASPNPVTQGNTTFLTATVTETDGSAIPTGVVTFSYQGSVLGSGNLASGVATLPLGTSGFSSGTYSITAAYGGDSGNGASSGAVSLVVQ
jgi:hypothetical protein